jgi:hypothetical protein
VCSSDLDNKDLKNHVNQRYEIDAKKIAGDEGEKRLKYFILSNPNFSNSHIFSSKRIFDPTVGHRREIDIIVLTKKMIYIIECKNWAGKIISFNENNPKIIYQANNLVKEERDNPILENIHKVNILYDSILKNISQDIPRRYLTNKIIFINKNMVYPQNFESGKHVITYKSLQDYFSSEKTVDKFSFQKIVISGILKLIKTEELTELTMSRKYKDLPYYDKIYNYLNDLPTWDYMSLKVDSGEEILYNGDIKYYKDVFLNKVYLNSLLNVQIKLNKSLIFPLLLGYSNLNAYIKFLDKYNNIKKGVVPINSKGSILFHHPGDQKPKEYSILDVSTIAIGNLKKNNK